MKQSKFNVGDYCYSIFIGQLNTITINRCIVNNVYYNSKLKEYIIGYDIHTIKAIRTLELSDNEYIYDSQNPKHIISFSNDPLENKEKEIKDCKRIANTISGSACEYILYTKSELTLSLIKELINKNLEDRKKLRKRVEEDYIKCYFTNEKLIRVKRDFVLDGPTVYISEKSNIRYEKWPRATYWICYYNNKEYKLNLNNNKFELIEEVKPKVNKLNKKRFNIFKKLFKNKKNSLFQPITSRVFKHELIKVKPMATPITNLNYLDFCFGGEQDKPKRTYKFLDGKIRETKTI